MVSSCLYLAMYSGVVNCGKFITGLLKEKVRARQSKGREECGQSISHSSVASPHASIAKKEVH